MLSTNINGSDPGSHIEDHTQSIYEYMYVNNNKILTPRHAGRKDHHRLRYDSHLIQGQAPRLPLHLRGGF